MESSGLAEVVEWEQAPADLKLLRSTSTDAETDARVRHFGTMWDHGMGTAPMGKVLDSELRVKDIRNLRCVDAGILSGPIAATPSGCYLHDCGDGCSGACGRSIETLLLRGRHAQAMCLRNIPKLSRIPHARDNTSDETTMNHTLHDARLLQSFLYLIPRTCNAKCPRSSPKRSKDWTIHPCPHLRRRRRPKLCLRPRKPVKCLS